MSQAPETKRSAGPRSLALQAERTLKEADRLLKESGDTSPHERASAQLEQARAWALLELARNIRRNRDG